MRDTPRRSPGDVASEITTTPAPLVCTSASSVSYIVMDLLVTAPAQAHQVAFIIRSASRQRHYVMDLLNLHKSPFLQTHLTKRMNPDISVTDPSPWSSVSLAGRISTLKMFIVMIHDLFMIITIYSIRQSGTSRISAWPLWFPWHLYSYPCTDKGWHGKIMKKPEALPRPERRKTRAIFYPYRHHCIIKAPE